MKPLNHYVLHLRPRSWPIVAGHMAVGYLIAVSPSGWMTHMPKLCLGAIIWSIMLNGGTLAFNSAFDRDTGNIGYLDSPPPVPKRLWFLGLLLMISGGISAFFISYSFTIAYWICFFMSVAYSCPPLRLKARAGFDIAICVIGYGALTTFAGWSCARGSLTPFIVLTCLAFTFLFGTLYPLTQIYQSDEDHSKGDKTFTVAMGLHWSLLFSLLCLFCSFSLFFYLSFLLQSWWYLFLFPLLVWLIILIPWIKRGAGYPAKLGMYRSLWAWIITDLTVVIIFSVLV
ncbi:MAG: hypothetical protein D8M57_10905 [Candidatus Scalindua sp. AMX11]|nr:MAG: hypothetical protein DWQ00_16150 [Candidatus Scalindua sp.]NOG83732.1 UbiA family prenyltransferase [Planctomycetota bacterium]RZV73820.1 MAG: hypothetical protein EX341_13250 [Candidatus Scalindua sp. SCAELEC01]TDE64826.1 MAG: hypothetical protein D8M57_10905 [Candidatus Scalindua sp. AMX11]